MKTGKYFFYGADTIKKDHDEFFTVYEVNIFNGDIDEADRKARTIAIRNDKKLAGGMFNTTCKPYNFKTNYTIVRVPDNTKIDPLNKHDLFIIDLIKRESEMEYIIL